MIASGLSRANYIDIGVHHKHSGLYDIYLDGSLQTSDLASQVSGTPNGFFAGAQSSGSSLSVYYDSVQYGETPEPSTFIIWSLLGALGIGYGWWRRRRP